MFGTLLDVVVSAEGASTAIKEEYVAIFMDVFDSLMIIKVNGGE